MVKTTNITEVLGRYKEEDKLYHVIRCCYLLNLDNVLTKP